MPSANAAERFSLSQRLLLLILAAVQFIHIVDFIILMPLAPHLQRDLGLRAQAFGVVVSAYGLAAFLTGLLLAPWLDRFDRKPTLLVLFTGFTLGTLLCAVAPNFGTLLVGRFVAGAFGGVSGSVVNAIVGDAFPPSRRGTAMGFVMSGFSIATIVGVPLGLVLAGLPGQGWRSPFAILAAAGLVLTLLAARVMPSIAGHLEGDHERATFWEVLSRPAHRPAFALILLLSITSFLLFPYVPSFLVNNLGLSEGVQLPLVYVFGGAATLMSMNVIGRLSDRFAKLTVFRVVAVVTMVVMVVLTCLPPGTSLAATLTVTTLLFIFSSGRMVPGMAMVTGVAEPRVRGSFMSILSSVQQLGAGVAPLVSALFVRDEGAGAMLTGFPIAGVLSAAVGLSTLVVAGLLRPAGEGIKESAPTELGSADDDPADGSAVGVPEPVVE
jgi:multidrug resistance protein